MTAVAATGCAVYGGLVLAAWLRYGKDRAKAKRGSVINDFLPAYEVREHHWVYIHASVETAFRAACDLKLDSLWITRTLFETRELCLAESSTPKAGFLGLVAQAKQWGWGVLFENPGSEIVFGAVTQPWIAHPVFQAIDPLEFRSFQEPGYVKIVWNLRVEPRADGESILSTETRAVATDSESRASFRRYWSLVRPGVLLIRWTALWLARRAAERPAFGRDEIRRQTYRCWSHANSVGGCAGRCLSGPV